MPVSCPEGGKPRFRAKKTKKGTVRLAFCGNKVIEAKNLKTGDTHTPSEFKAEGRVRRKATGK